MPGLDAKEQETPPEISSTPNAALASFFRDVYKIERKTEQSSGMISRFSEASMSKAFSEWLATEGMEINYNLSVDDIYELGDFIIAATNAVNTFAGEKLKNGYVISGSLPNVDKPNPDELLRFRCPYQIEESPSAIVYLDDGRIRYRAGKKSDEKMIFDLSADLDRGTFGVIQNRNSEFNNSLGKKLLRFVKEKEVSSKGSGGTWSIADILEIERDAVKGGKADVGWDEYDKSFDAGTDGIKAAGYLVFGYIDGEGKFYPADSKENTFDVYDKTGDIQVIAYNPQPTAVGVEVKGFGKDGRPILGLDDGGKEK